MVGGVSLCQGLSPLVIMQDSSSQSIVIKTFSLINPHLFIHENFQIWTKAKTFFETLYFIADYLDILYFNFWLYKCSLLNISFFFYKPTVADSGTVVTVSAIFKAEILNFLAKQNLQKGSSSSSPNTLSAFLGPEIMLSAEIMMYLVGQSKLQQGGNIFWEIFKTDGNI